MIELNKLINESSLSRLQSKTAAHDAGALTAFRGNLTRSVNQERNKKLLAYLTNAGYSVTKVKGAYIEQHGSDNAKEVGEESFYVIDHKDSGKLKTDLQKLGALYDQDSILWIPKGKGSELIGTSKRDDAFPSFGQTHKFSGSEWGKSSGPFFSRIRGRQFAMKESAEELFGIELIECEYPLNINGIRVLKAYAKEVEKELNKAL